MQKWPVIPHPLKQGCQNLSRPVYFRFLAIVLAFFVFVVAEAALS